MPRGFVHDGEYDFVFLFQILGRLPSVVEASNGRKYLYFEDMDADKLKIVRKMGFRPHRHKSKRYKPAKVIYRAPISMLMQQSAWTVASKIELERYNNEYNFPRGVDVLQSNKKYLEYIKAYNSKVNQKTK